MAANRNPPPKKPPPPPAPAHFVPGSRATAPMGLEETSESAWARFEELQRTHEVQFQATQPAARPAPTVPPGFEPTEPMGLAQVKAKPAALAPAVIRDVTLEEAMVMARRNNRACPMPAQWSAFHKMLPPRVSEGRTFTPPAPVDGAAWNATSAMQKRLRLRDQIEWAGRVGALQQAYQFLVSLPEEQWHHFD
ncbi:hypothetical protein [Ramlibacter humi]|uniref:Uncharacterized protein n=1 Tax=Ramlibacter humi TaxID=2530451 RepID=A0A4Z0C7X0_9BURK|nr:hypothetical protein [Ramlibacter humi]TFZ07776.1 hypothetical protein EZ216_01020 [Ramlibacter humi]